MSPTRRTSLSLPAVMFRTIALTLLFWVSNATIDLLPSRDAIILEVDPSASNGDQVTLAVGSGIRSVLFFDFSEINFSEVTKATLMLFERSAVGNVGECSPADDTSACTTAHVVTTEFGEGTSGEEVMGGVSWLYSMFPTPWTTPGGDFASEVLATEMVVNDTVAMWELDIVILQAAVGSGMYQGFLLRNDNSMGSVDYRSRECQGLTSSVSFPDCIGAGQPPRLRLEGIDSPPPSAMPTMAPMMMMSSPTMAPVSSTQPPSAAVATIVRLQLVLSVMTYGVVTCLGF